MHIPAPPPVHPRSNSGAYEILYHDGETGRRAKGSQRDSSWATWTSVLGFPVMGIWRVGEKDTFDGTDINAVCRTHRPEDGSGVFPPDGGDLVVAASDDGMVRLFNYPCVVENAPCG